MGRAGSVGVRVALPDSRRTSDAQQLAERGPRHAGGARRGAEVAARTRGAALRAASIERAPAGGRGSRRKAASMSLASMPLARVVASAARQRTLRSSRTLPGQSWAARRARAAGVSVARPDLPRELLEQHAGDGRDVAAPLAQRRDVDDEALEPVEEVAAELAGGRRAARGARAWRRRRGRPPRAPPPAAPTRRTS